MRRSGYLGIFFAMVASIAFAHTGATGIVKDRMMAMKDLGGLVKQLVKMDWSNTGKAQADIREVSDKILAHAKAMPKFFPAGSNKKPSEALDAIWTNKAEFAAAIGNMEKAAMTIRQSAVSIESSDALKPFIKSLGDTCSACHGDFRKKKE